MAAPDAEISVTDTEVSWPRYECELGVDGRVYVAGGIGPSGLAPEMLVYDLAADRWSTASGPPTPREHLGGLAAAHERAAR